MDRTVCAETQCLYKGALYLLYEYTRNFVSKRRTWIEFQNKKVLEIYGEKDKVTKEVRVKKLRIYSFRYFLGDQLTKRKMCGARGTSRD